MTVLDYLNKCVGIKKCSLCTIKPNGDFLYCEHAEAFSNWLYENQRELIDATIITDFEKLITQNMEDYYD